MPLCTRWQETKAHLSKSASEQQLDLNCQNCNNACLTRCGATKTHLSKSATEQQLDLNFQSCTNACFFARKEGKLKNKNTPQMHHPSRARQQSNQKPGLSHDAIPRCGAPFSSSAWLATACHHPFPTKADVWKLAMQDLGHLCPCG